MIKTIRRTAVRDNSVDNDDKEFKNKKEKRKKKRKETLIKVMMRRTAGFLTSDESNVSKQDSFLDFISTLSYSQHLPLL